MTTRVLVVDDSAVVRQLVGELVSAMPGFALQDVARDPIIAMEKMQKEWPDVIVLDVDMPRMDGITFLQQIMATRPTAVLICSSLTQRGSEMAMRAFACGAVEVVGKPDGGAKATFLDFTLQLSHAIRAAAVARVGRLRCQPTPSLPHPPAAATTVAALAPPPAVPGAVPGKPPPRLSADAILAAPTGRENFVHTERVVVVGTSTGGTQALEQLLAALSPDCPGLAIVQHMPPGFTASFAERLNRMVRIDVKEAASGDRITCGRALIAPGGYHLTLRRDGGSYCVEVLEGPPVSRHKPSVDVLFRSAARVAGHNAMGVIMTGMGDDGARGLKEMLDSGAQTIAQDEDSCVVYGMPREAVKLGAVREVLALDAIPAAIMRRWH